MRREISLRCSHSWITALSAKLDAAVASGAVTPDVIDTQVTRILTSMYRVGIMDTPQPTGKSAVNATSESHAALAQHLAEQAAVLLKNFGGLLPLRRKKGTTIAVIGAAADCNATRPPCHLGCYSIQFWTART